MLLDKQYYGLYSSICKGVDRRVFTVKEEAAYLISCLCWMSWTGFLIYAAFDPQKPITVTLCLVFGGIAGLGPVVVSVYRLVSPIGKARLMVLGLPTPDLHWNSDALSFRKIFAFAAVAKLSDRDLLTSLISTGENKLKKMEESARKRNEVNLKVLLFILGSLFVLIEPAHLSYFFVSANVGLAIFGSFLAFSLNWMHQNEYIEPFGRYVHSLRVIQAGPSVVTCRRSI